MAWLAPMFGSLLYAGFGVNRVKRRARMLKGANAEVRPAASREENAVVPIERLKIAVGNITGQRLEFGEIVEVLKCGDEAYPKMLAAIEAAQTSVDLSTFIFRTDEIGQKFVAALVRAHRRGVGVRVLIDGFGGGFLRSPAYHALRAEGVPAARFLHSTLPWKMPFLNLRLHKKSLVVDHVAAFIGGLNIGAENLVAQNPKAPVRDIHFRVEGPVVHQVQQDFDDDWAFTTGERPIEGLRPPAPLLAGQSAGRTIVSGPDQDGDPLPLALSSAINIAQRSIRIATPYFLPDEQIVTALQLAALRGVEVHLVLPAVNNHVVVGWAAEAHVRPLLRAGCRLWRDPPPFDHAKLMTVDGVWSLIGSANWDMRSLRLNFELTMEFYDAELARRLTEIIETRCVRPLTLEEIDARPLLIKLRDAAARLMMPYM
jgi:cardiolipin synthase